jgi:hypothetical protein
MTLLLDVERLIMNACFSSFYNNVWLLQVFEFCMLPYASNNVWLLQVFELPQNGALYASENTSQVF